MKPEVVYSCTSLLSYVLVGAIRSYVAFLIPQLEQPDSLIKLNSDEKSWLTSFISILTPIACISSGFIMDFFGRQAFLRVLFLPFFISWFLIAFAKTIELLCIGILLQGIGVGMSMCVATYVAEISSTHRRGALLSILEITHSIGVVICYVSMSYFKWYTVAFGFGIFSTICIILAFRLPESPLWLYLKGEKEKSINTLVQIRRMQVEDLDHEVLDMEKASSEKTKTDWITTAKNCCRAWKQLSITLGLAVLSQHTGYQIVISYIIAIVDYLKIPYKSSDVSIMYSISGLVAGCLTPYTIHNCGRKITLGMSALFMGTSMAVIAIYEEIFYDQDTKWFAWIVPAAMVVYIFAQTLGVYPIGFMIGGEIFPNEARGTLNGLYGALTYIYSTIFLKIFPSCMARYGIKSVLWSFALFGFLLTLFAMFILPESRGKTLNEIQEEYFQKTKKKKNVSRAI